MGCFQQSCPINERTPTCMMDSSPLCAPRAPIHFFWGFPNPLELIWWGYPGRGEGQEVPLHKQKEILVLTWWHCWLQPHKLGRDTKADSKSLHLSDPWITMGSYLLVSWKWFSKWDVKSDSQSEQPTPQSYQGNGNPRKCIHKVYSDASGTNSVAIQWKAVCGTVQEGWRILFKSSAGWGSLKLLWFFLITPAAQNRLERRPGDKLSVQDILLLEVKDSAAFSCSMCRSWQLTHTSR